MNKVVREGSVVRVKTGFVVGRVVTAVVEKYSDDIRDGRPGIDYKYQDRGDWVFCWAYMDQVENVILY